MRSFHVSKKTSAGFDHGPIQNEGLLPRGLWSRARNKILGISQEVATTLAAVSKLNPSQVEIPWFSIPTTLQALVLHGLGGPWGLHKLILICLFDFKGFL